MAKVKKSTSDKKYEKGKVYTLKDGKKYKYLGVDKNGAHTWEGVTDTSAGKDKKSSSGNGLPRMKTVKSAPRYNSKKGGMTKRKMGRWTKK